MGNEGSNQNNSKKGDKKDEASLGFCDNVSSYQGMKSETSENTSKKSSERLSEKTTERTTEVPDLKVSMLFEWKEGGNNVAITGSFVNWQQYLQMNRNQNGAFELLLSLDPGIHQFKFIVNNQWKCSNHYPMINDGNYNTNNVIDTMKSSCITSPQKQQQTNQDPNQNQQQLLSSDQNRDTGMKKKSYSVIIPNKTEMNTEAPNCPFHYLQSFNINHNTRQNKIGKQKFLQYNERDLLSENNSYKKLMVPPHVNL